MSTNEYSSDEFFQFIDFIGKKSLIKSATVRNWRNAATQLFTVLEREELADLREIDVDLLVERFSNKRRDVTGASLKTYKGRYKSAINEFFSWVKNRVDYQPSIASRNRGAGGAPKIKKKNESNDKSKKTPELLSRNNNAHVDFPIPIRSGHIVTIVNLPHDLTKEEAEKISAVIKALGFDSQKE